jgi:hypothetical protein
MTAAQLFNVLVLFLLTSLWLAFLFLMALANFNP